jgi:hypothetical protein
MKTFEEAKLEMIRVDADIITASTTDTLPPGGDTTSGD